MDSDVGKAERYRERAAGLRKIADALPPGNTQRMILGVAMEYERLADMIDHRDVPADPTSVVAALKKPDNIDP
jgi:hypothetical protein